MKTKRRLPTIKEREESIIWWNELTTGSSLHKIAKKYKLSVWTIRRRLIRFYGYDYFKKSKSSSIVLVAEGVKKIKNERRKEEVKNWLEKNAELLREMDLELESDFYSEKTITNKEKNRVLNYHFE
ncbi:hypothetical protein [Nostoc sp. CCY 9925]|uniref:hypothetical protein n=1 Tax=Nostoc sp. CCY 9925 TaxID=3103865 RepID=UPI0039C676C8